MACPFALGAVEYPPLKEVIDQPAQALPFLEHPARILPWVASWVALELEPAWIHTSNAS